MATQLTPAELAAANAQGLTPSEYEASYPGKAGVQEGGTPDVSVDDKTAREAPGRTKRCPIPGRGSPRSSPSNSRHPSPPTSSWPTLKPISTWP